MRAEGKAQLLPSRIAGAALILVGVINLVLGTMAVADPFLGLQPAQGWGLIVAGVVLVAVGAPVWRGSRLATAIALTVVASILVIGVFGALAGDGEGLEVLAVPLVLTVLLGVALLRQRRAGTRPTTDAGRSQKL